MTSYERLHGLVLAVLVEEDPMDLADPDNDLTDEYDGEAREIARRLGRVGDDAAAVAEAIAETFAEAFGTTLPLGRIARAAAAYALGESGLGDLAARLGDAEVVATFVRSLIAAHGRRAVVTVETHGGGCSSVLVTAPPGEDRGTEPLSIDLLGPGDGEIWVRRALVELGAGDLGRHQPLREPVTAVERLVVATVAGDVEWCTVVRRRDDVVLSEKVSIATADGPFEIDTSFGNGGWGRTRRTYGAAVPYPRQLRNIAIEDEGHRSGSPSGGAGPRPHAYGSKRPRTRRPKRIARRWRPARRWLGLRTTVTSVTTDEQVGP